jgi:hypothetical protein
MTWMRAIVVGLGLVVAGALYIRLRWHRSPQAYRAMLVVAAYYFVAGAMVGAWMLSLTGPRASVSVPEVASPGADVGSPSAFASPVALAPMINPDRTGDSDTAAPLRPCPCDPARSEANAGRCISGCDQGRRMHARLV